MATKQGNGKDIVKKEVKKVLLDVACGLNKKEGFIGIDYVKAKGVDIVHDLNKYPWPIKSNSVDQIHCSHYIEHLPHEVKGYPNKDGWFLFFDEINRILKKPEFSPESPNVPISGFADFFAPYYSSMRAWWDPTHRRAISEMSFQYLNKNWRDINKLDHYHVDSDFNFSYGYSLNGSFSQKNEELRAFAVRHYNNVVDDINVRLWKNVVG